MTKGNAEQELKTNQFQKKLKNQPSKNTLYKHQKHRSHTQ